MATFSDLQSRLRDDILAESDTSFYSDADLLAFLTEASVEIAGMGGFPTASSASAVASAATSVTAPTDLSNIEFREVAFNNYQLEHADMKTVRLYRGIGGQTRYYDYSPREGGSIELSPAAHTSGTLYIEYVQDLSSTSYTGGDEVWGGTLPDWHDAVLYLAGIKAYERGYEYEKAQYWMQRLERRLQPLAIYLDNNNVLNIATRMESQNAGR